MADQDQEGGNAPEVEGDITRRTGRKARVRDPVILPDPGMRPPGRMETFTGDTGA